MAIAFVPRGRWIVHPGAGRSRTRRSSDPRTTAASSAPRPPCGWRGPTAAPTRTTSKTSARFRTGDGTRRNARLKIAATFPLKVGAVARASCACGAAGHARAASAKTAPIVGRRALRIRSLQSLHDNSSGSCAGAGTLGGTWGDISADSSQPRRQRVPVVITIEIGAHAGQAIVARTD